MRARPGRLLPSVVVGGLLISGLALGAGVAGAADTCTYEGKKYPVTESSQIQAAPSGKCELKPGLLSSLVLSTVMSALDPIVDPVIPSSAAPAPETPASTTPSGSVNPATTTTTAAPAGGTGTKNGAAAAPAAAPLIAAPAPAPVLPAALGAAGPVGALPPLAGIAPAGLASNLFSANTYDPGLLFGSPLGNAASALYSPKVDSAVTTVSQAQALAAPTGGGYGTPAAIGVIILACLVGIAVRHRVISRMKNRELPAAEYQPRHAAPDAEDAEPETELHDAAEARTLVVLSRR